MPPPPAARKQQANMLIVSPAGEVQETEGGDVVIGPFGTVSFYVDRNEGVLRIFCEPDPDERGWQIALDYARSVSDGQPPDEYMDDGVVVFVFRLASAGGSVERLKPIRPWLNAAGVAAATAAPLALASCC
jgi:hypothetical protein